MRDAVDVPDVAAFAENGFLKVAEAAPRDVAAGPFGVIARSRKLATALDAVCGVGAWQPRGSLGNVPVRFPVAPTDDDRGWHVVLNTPQLDGSWAVSGRPHTLQTLTILSDHRACGR